MRYYPVFLELEGKPVLVVGGGAVAQRKVETFLEYGALIHIISRQLTDKLKALVDSEKVRYIGEEFHEEKLEGLFLVVAATDDKQLNHKISECAHKRAMLINAVDQPDDCNFIVPSIVKQGDLSIAVSTSGKSPALAKQIRKKLEAEYGREYEIFLKIMGRLRNKILSKGLSQDKNSRIFHEIVDSGILKAIAMDDWETVESIFKRILPRDVAVMDIL